MMRYVCVFVLDAARCFLSACVLLVSIFSVRPVVISLYIIQPVESCEWVTPSLLTCLLLLHALCSATRGQCGARTHTCTHLSSADRRRVIITLEALRTCNWKMCVSGVFGLCVCLCVFMGKWTRVVVCFTPSVWHHKGSKEQRPALSGALAYIQTGLRSLSSACQYSQPHWDSRLRIDQISC